MIDVKVPIVLVVEDEPGLLRLFTGLIKRLDCEVFPAEGGQTAIDILNSVVPDLLVLDLAMPDVSGVEVLRYARTLPHLEAMKVVILTARPNMLPEVEELGFDKWLSKPLSPHALLAAVKEILDDL